MNVLIAIVSQAQEHVLNRRDEEYANILANTLVGLDAWHPRRRRRAFCDQSPEQHKHFEYHNEVGDSCMLWTTQCLRQL